MHDYSHTRLSDNFINLTDQPVLVYEGSTGEIVEFVPSTEQELPKYSAEQTDQPIIHYIVDKSQASRIARTGRPLDDIAVAHGKNHGRDGAIITSLFWGKDLNTGVVLYENAHAKVFPHL